MKKETIKSDTDSKVFPQEDGSLVYGKRKTNPFCASFLGLNPNVSKWFLKLIKVFLKERKLQKRHESIQKSFPKKIVLLFMGEGNQSLLRIFFFRNPTAFSWFKNMEKTFMKERERKRKNERNHPIDTSPFKRLFPKEIAFL